MPIMAPFSDYINIARQATVMAFQFGDGFTNMITPTSGVLIGVLGFSSLEGWSLLDSLYMTIITLTTSGFNEVHPLTEGGRMFTMVILTMGVFVVAFFITMLSRMIVEGELEIIYGRKKLDKKIGKLKNHVVICGYGKMGSHVAKGFEAAKQDVVIIENDEKVCADLLENGYLYVKGDARHSDVLKKAGLAGARAIVTAMTDDADNLFSVITAKSINSDIRVISMLIAAPVM